MCIYAYTSMRSYIRKNIKVGTQLIFIYDSKSNYSCFHVKYLNMYVYIYI